MDEPVGVVVSGIEIGKSGWAEGVGTILFPLTLNAGSRWTDPIICLVRIHPLFFITPAASALSPFAVAEARSDRQTSFLALVQVASPPPTSFFPLPPLLPPWTLV